MPAPVPTGADLPATLTCWQLGILHLSHHHQLGLLSAGFRPAWRLSDPSGAATASTLGFCCVCGATRARHWLRDGRTGGWVARDGRASRHVSTCGLSSQVIAYWRISANLAVADPMVWWPWRRRAVSEWGDNDSLNLLPEGRTPVLLYICVTVSACFTY